MAILHVLLPAILALVGQSTPCDHPDKDTTRVLTNFKNGYLDVIVKIIKVYPIPNCTIKFNENLISRGLTTKAGVNGIFYKVVEEVEHSFDVCNGQVIVTCVVGKTEIPIHQEIFNRCSKKKEESPDYIGYLNIPIITGVLLFGILLLGIVCFARYGQLRKVRLFRGKDQRTLEREETASQLEGSLALMSCTSFETVTTIDC